MTEGETSSIKCPACGKSGRVWYRRRTSDYACGNCGHTWKDAPARPGRAGGRAPEKATSKKKEN